MKFSRKCFFNLPKVDTVGKTILLGAFLTIMRQFSFKEKLIYKKFKIQFVFQVFPHPFLSNVLPRSLLLVIFCST